MKIPHPRLRPCVLQSLSVMTALLVLFVPRTAPAQTASQPPVRKPFAPTTDVSLGIFGQLTNTRTPVSGLTSLDSNAATGGLISQVTQGTSPTAGVLGTFHQSFKPWLGYNVNFGYSRFSENYSYGQSYVTTGVSPFPPYERLAVGSIRTDMYELTIASVFQGPRTKRFSTFGQFGGGGLFFLPRQTVDPGVVAHAREQTRPAMVFGVGMNYKLSRRLDLRAEYRGLFYKSPDFNLEPFDPTYLYGFEHSFPIARLFTITNAPAVSLVYHPGGEKKPKTQASSR